jgi:hypothetical protein
MIGTDYAGGGIGLGPRPATPEPDPYPAPEITSRDGIPGPAKAAVASLVALAERLGWTTITTYARGCLPHATHGRPGPVRDSLAVRMVNGDRRAVAVYRDQGSSWKWDLLLAWDLTTFPRSYGTLAGFQDALA